VEAVTDGGATRREDAGGVRARCLVILLLFATLGCEAPQALAPDVVLITVDTLRADHLGTYGFEHDSSPRIDRLARQSVVFERAIAASGRTAPSHASILTSRYTREHSIGYKNGPTKLVEQPTLARIFSGAGYDTGAFVGNLLLTGFSGLHQGFETYDAKLETPEKNRSHVVERIAEATTQLAMEWIERSGERPLFLWVHY